MTPDQIKNLSREKLIKLFPHLENETDTLDFYQSFIQEIQDLKNIQDFEFTEDNLLIIKTDTMDKEQSENMAEHLNTYLFEIIDGYKILLGVTINEEPYSKIEIEIPS